jgi:membrane-associated phospholipid phosphatase
MRAPNHASAGHVTAVAICLSAFAGFTLGVFGVWNANHFDAAIAIQVSRWREPALTDVMLVITSLGDSAYLIFIGFLIAATLAARRAWRATGAAVTAFLTLPLAVSTIKSTLARARPTAELYSGADAFSFPSGHAANSALIYGTLALMTFTSLKGAAKWVATSALVLLIVLIAFSRIYTGAHWPSDALAGLALGAGVLSMLSWILRHTPPKPATPRTISFLLACFALTAPLYAWYVLPFARTFYTALT